MVAEFAGAAIAAPFWCVAAIGLTVVSAVYLAIVVIVAIPLSGLRRRALLMALAFAVMHFAHGAGFLSHVLSLGRWPYRADPPNVPSLEGVAQDGERAG